MSTLIDALSRKLDEFKIKYPLEFESLKSVYQFGIWKNKVAPEPYLQDHDNTFSIRYRSLSRVIFREHIAIRTDSQYTTIVVEDALQNFQLSVINDNGTYYIDLSKEVRLIPEELMALKILLNFKFIDIPLPSTYEFVKRVDLKV